MDKVLLILDKNIKYDFGQKHPMNPERIRLTYSLIKSLGLLEKEGVCVERAPLATDKELMLAHSKSYIEAVKESARGKANWHFGLGTSDNPIFPEIHNSSAKIVGGTLLAAKKLAKKGVAHAFNPWGGLHHALSNRASGFCIYNDAACAIAWLIKKGFKVAYVDIDAHHGDGVQWIFYSSPQVLTISIHESGHYLFPGSGFESERGKDEGLGFSVNIPLDPEASEADYLLVIRELVKPLIKSFQPDILITQNGCDQLERDPIAHLRVSLMGYYQMIKELHQIAHESTDGKILALGGGGYDVYYSVPIAWASLFSELCHSEVPECLPEEFLKDLSNYLSFEGDLSFFGKEVKPSSPLLSTKKTIERLKKEFLN